MTKRTALKLGIVAACAAFLLWRYWPVGWWPVIQTPRTNAASEG